VDESTWNESGIGPFRKVGLWTRQTLAGTNSQGSYWSQPETLARSSFSSIAIRLANSMPIFLLNFLASTIAPLPRANSNFFRRLRATPRSQKGGSIFSRDLKLAAVLAVDAC